MNGRRVGHTRVTLMETKKNEMAGAQHVGLLQE
jgi:hypothetical protein